MERCEQQKFTGKLSIIMYDGRVLLISVVVPVCGDGHHLSELVAQIDALRRSFEEKTDRLRLGELILVNDNAISENSETLTTLKATFEWLTVLNFSRRYGRQSATIAGVLHTSGDWVITLNEVWPLSPSAIPELLEGALRTRADVIYARASRTTQVGVLQRFAGAVSAVFAGWSTELPNIGKRSSFRVMRGTVARAAGSICGPGSMLDKAISWFTTRIEFVEIDHEVLSAEQQKGSASDVNPVVQDACSLVCSGGVSLSVIGAKIAASLSRISVFALLGLVGAGLFLQDQIQDLGLIVGAAIFLLALSGLLFFMANILKRLTLLVERTNGNPVFFAIDRSSDECLPEFGKLKNK